MTLFFLFNFSISSQGCKLGKEHLRIQLIFAFWKIIQKTIFFDYFFTGQDNFILLCRKFSTKKSSIFPQACMIGVLQDCKNLIFCLYFFDLLFINCKSNIYQLQDFLKNKLRRSIKGKETDWQTEMIKTSSITQIIWKSSFDGREEERELLHACQDIFCQDIPFQWRKPIPISLLASYLYWQLTLPVT